MKKLTVESWNFHFFCLLTICCDLWLSVLVLVLVFILYHPVVRLQTFEAVVRRAAGAVFIENCVFWKMPFLNFTRLDSLDRNFILNFFFQASRVKFKNGIHSTRPIFHCFVSSKFRVLVEYFRRSIVILMHLQKMFSPTKWWYIKCYFDNKYVL